MVGMGPRTIKTAIVAGLSIWLAELTSLEFSTFAGIIAILCMEKTKKKTVDTIYKKFIACLLSLLFGGLFFELAGYTALVFPIFILLFVPLLVRLKIQDGFVTSMVVVLHIYSLRELSLEILFNELAIIVIGTGLAFLVNSFMPNLKNEIEQYKRKIEQSFSTILFEFSAYLRNPDRNWDGREILEAEELINQGKSLAILDVENHLLRRKNQDYFYLEMREEQLEVLHRMMPIISSLGQTMYQKEIFADFLEDLSKRVHSGDTTDQSMKKLNECWKLIWNTDLPKTKEEFEIRANLFYLMNQMEEYLIIKKKLLGSRQMRTASG